MFDTLETPTSKSLGFKWGSIHIALEHNSYLRDIAKSFYYIFFAISSISSAPSVKYWIACDISSIAVV